MMPSGSVFFAIRPKEGMVSLHSPEFWLLGLLRPSLGRL